MRKILAISVATIVLTVFPGEARAPATSQVKPGRILSFGARQSGNWAGYNLGYLATNTLYTQVSGTWTVPTPSKHQSGVNEYSVTWVGIGGGCVDQSCLVVDGTLIQAGTGQDISSSGVRTYYAWWEIIPLPLIRISMPVSAGHVMYVDIRQAIPGSDLWTITIKNRTNGRVFKLDIFYPSTMLTAEWVEERPLVGGFTANLPQLTNPRFNNARVNGHLVQLKAKDQVVMVEGSTRLATPSGPDPDKNGFNMCTYTTSCTAPGSP